MAVGFDLQRVLSHNIAIVGLTAHSTPILGYPRHLDGSLSGTPLTTLPLELNQTRPLLYGLPLRVILLVLAAPI